MGLDGLGLVDVWSDGLSVRFDFLNMNSLT
jgi:hypothetical protein